MKRVLIAAFGLTLGLGMVGCGGAHGDDPGHAYMPDMYYSRAYEAYGYNNVEGEYDSLRSRGINYNGLLVPGTIARGDAMPTHMTEADTSAANSLQNPLATQKISAIMMKEAERIYLVNCGICHGSALDGNGPLWKGGDGPYAPAPRPLNADYAKALTDGSMYHTITYGKGQMGSYASQLRPEQRWMVINYIRSKHGSVAADSTAVPAAAEPPKTPGASVTSQATADAQKNAQN